MNLDAPTQLPVRSLSHSSIELYLKCPEKWRRRYVANEYEPPVGIMVLGRAVHQAEAQSYHHQKDHGQPHTLEQVLDDFSTTMENEERSEAEIEWEDETPGSTKDRGVKMLRSYHRVIPYNMNPNKVEAKFELRLRPEYKWTVNGYIDVVGSYFDGLNPEIDGVHDLKTVKKKMPQHDVDASVQASLYTYAMMHEDEDSLPFLIHEIKDNESRIVPTTRTRETGERYMERIAKVAREIDWRMSSGEWQGAPPNAWWCRPTKCGYFATCPMATR